MMALELLDTKWAGDGSQQAGKHFGDRCLVVAVVCRPPRDRVGTVYTRYGGYYRAPRCVSIAGTIQRTRQRERLACSSTGRLSLALL
jgi:hypothetical protein